MSSKRTRLQERYVLREVLGRGGMGVVYRAVDQLMNREVALKTILEVDSADLLAQFYREWSILATMVHPNIVSIYDIGEFEQNGSKKPFFVMPLLPGVTLDRLIKDGSPRLSVKTVVDVIGQASRGLQAAHEQGLVHRDVKPSNIFVMDDNSVKLIDFGIARAVSAASNTVLKGTLFYLAPEQIDMKPPSPLWDQFSLAVVTYEALTRRRPFDGGSDGEVAGAIRKLTPPAVWNFNSEVSVPVSQVIHKALAKQPWNRFPDTREFGDALLKALRNEPLEYFDRAKIKPRLERASSCFEAGDLPFASEVLAELEGEGHVDHDIALLRGRINQALRQTHKRQLLESARRFFEASEYQLSLRKIQEAIDLDPNDADALALKAQVEKERREKKIEEWIALAHQHLGNSAFQPAKEALDNVLRLMPNDTKALGLLAEINRHEQEYQQIRDEKGRLYQAAVQAWEKGEVTSALSRLNLLMSMDRDQPDANRSGTYQNFYNQVHTESDAIRNAYEEAKGSLADEKFDAALDICKRFLTRYPNHALFQALKFDVEERRRQALSAVIAETDRNVERESDLDRRAGLLEEARKLYPEEPHFERMLQLVRDKRDLVNSLIARARLFEERSQFVEAVDQWQILRSIHERQPGLSLEIERLTKRRDQQARANAKARWVEQTDKYLEAGDYGRARKSVESGLAEFPGEPELLELDKLARKSQERAAQAGQLLGQARDLADKGELDQSLPLLREAQQLDSRNSVIRTVLMNSLLEKARGLTDSDPEAADSFVQEVLRIEPDHAGARSLTSRIADSKRDGFFTWCLTQARRLQAEGDVDGALAVVAQGLSVAPPEPRLLTLQATLQRAKSEKTRTGDPAHTVAPPLPEPAPADGTDDPRPAGAAQTETPNLLVTANAPPASDLPPAPPVPPLPPPAATGRGGPVPKRWLFGGVTGAAALLIGMAALTLNRRSEAVRPAPAAESVKTILRAEPDGARIVVDGKPCGTSACEIALVPGAHQAQAEMEGYEGATSSFSVSPASRSQEIRLTLRPTSTLLTVGLEMNEAALVLDGVPAGSLKTGQTEAASLAPGKHILSIESGSSRLRLAVDISPGSVPLLDGPPEAKSIRVFILARAGSRAHLYGTVPNLSVQLDAKPAGVLGADGLDFSGLVSGPHELLLEGSGPAGHKRLVFESGPASSIFAYLMSDVTLGILHVLAGEDDAAIFVNGQKSSHATQRGQAYLYLPPRQYRIRVEKPGFDTLPEQTVDVRAGEESKTEFKLSTRRSTLVLHRGEPSAEVFVDGARVGAIGANGEFSANVEPGKHIIVIKREHFVPVQTDAILVSGAPYELEGKLKPITGDVRFVLNLTSSDVRLRLKREGDKDASEVTSRSVTLPEGNYSVLASAPRYQDASATFAVSNRQVVTVKLTLLPTSASEPRTPAPTAAFNLEDWLKLGWTRDGAAMEREGGDLTLAPFDLLHGSLTFSAKLLRGKRLEWVVDFRDDRNYRLFSLDDHFLQHTDILAGKKEKRKYAHDLDLKSLLTISIAGTPDRLVIKEFVNGAFKLIEDFNAPAPREHGTFGFHISKHDRVALVEFRYAPN